jgi:hypothetical protein
LAGPKVILRGEVLEVRNVDGRLHIAPKERDSDEWALVEPYDPLRAGRMNAIADKVLFVIAVTAADQKKDENALSDRIRVFANRSDCISLSINMGNIATIRDVGELLVLLRESLLTRAVAYINDEVAVCDCADGDPGRPTRPIAWIDNTGPARELLNTAYDADLACDASAWAALPLRYS